ncbi:glucosaminidase domain-containing protein [Shewanella sp. UCD-KL12]|uniref:glucosaminidase domain-containing protein n=1 Tax=Shewanella sp. UCD-KL12 TaxID=1917163 RepID=UPI000970280B|nr:glucosaminidase domain-containing protein [Shewanella sp. UCD-KL12]
MDSNIGKLILAVILVSTSLYWGLDNLNSNIDSQETNDSTGKLSVQQDSQSDALESANSNHPKLAKDIPSIPAKDVVLSSLDDLIALFDSLNYNTQSWLEGNREVPRLTFEGVSESWQQTSHQIPVQQKKMVFFRLMAPLILVSNENILLERQQIKSAALTSTALIKLAQKYKVVTDVNTPLTEGDRASLLQRVDIVPPSLVLAQAAEESGWATSRFTLEGNAFFGQWDFSGNGMIPKQQRKELGNYGLARFDTPLASVEGYMLNLNTNNAYQKLRLLREELRDNNEAITGPILAGTLDKYSERGQAYIDGIRELIRYNKLDQVDEAYLTNAAPLHLIGKNQ